MPLPTALKYMKNSIDRVKHRRQHFTVRILHNNSKKCLPMFQKNQKKSFTKTPLQACQTHLPSTALHRALSHLISALYAHKSAYTQQQCCMHATAWKSTTIQGREARHEPLTLVRKSKQASSDHTANILWEIFKPKQTTVGLEMDKSWKGKSSYLCLWESERLARCVLAVIANAESEPRHPRMQH